MGWFCRVAHQDVSIGWFLTLARVKLSGRRKGIDLDNMWHHQGLVVVPGLPRYKLILSASFCAHVESSHWQIEWISEVVSG